MRGLFGLVAISLFLIPINAGCRPSGPSEDMGTVVDEVPAVEGAEEPYVIPELGPSPSEAKEGEDSKPHSHAIPAAKPVPAAKPSPAAKPVPSAKPAPPAKPK